MVLAEFGVVNFWTYILGAFFIVLVPGPSTLFVLKTGIRYGIKKGYLAAVGVFIGDAVLMFLTWTGIAALIQTKPLLFNILRYLGAFYLLCLGGKILWSVIMRKSNDYSDGVKAAKAILQRSFVLSLTNPKAILFYVSFFVQFIDPSAKNTNISFLILAITLEVISFIYMSFLIFSGAFMTRYLQTKKNLVKIGNGLIGLLFIGFAVRLAMH